jgi:hypothetical protein
MTQKLLNGNTQARRRARLCPHGQPGHDAMIKCPRKAHEITGPPALCKARQRARGYEPVIGPPERRVVPAASNLAGMARSMRAATATRRRVSHGANRLRKIEAVPQQMGCV